MVSLNLSQLILFITGQSQYSAPVETYIRNWMPGGTVPYTPKGLAWRTQWGTLRHTGESSRKIALTWLEYSLIFLQSSVSIFVKLFGSKDN